MTTLPSRATIAVVEDDPSLRRALVQRLVRGGYTVREFEDGESCLRELRHLLPDVVILDLGLPGMHGFEVLERCKAEHPLVPVIMLTGEEQPDTIVKAVRMGAFEYLVKPVSTPRLLTTVGNAVSQRTLSERVRELEFRVQGGAFEGILGRSPAMHRVFTQMQRVARTDVSVLIRGESGSGKELVARALHEAGERASAPFVAINCAALPESLQESELFGHEKGAFTGATVRRAGRFEQADTGTLFLDEVGDLSLGLQAKLLRVLQERTFHRLGGAEEVHSDFRLIAATNRDLAGAVYEDRFREDLYYRIAVFEITLPPLRDRGDDVLLIAHLLARDLGNQLRGEPSEIPPETDDLLRSYHWPGNVRELQNVLQRGIVLSSSPVIPPWALPTLGASGRRTERAGPEVASKIPVSPAGRSPSGTAGGPEAGGTDDQPEARSVAANAWDQLLAGLTLEEIERRAIESAIRRHGGNRTRAAEELGIARTTVYRKLEGS